jgi:hypothetical protein
VHKTSVAFRECTSKSASRHVVVVAVKEANYGAGPGPPAQARAGPLTLTSNSTLVHGILIECIEYIVCLS